MNKYTYTYWTCTNPNEGREKLPNGKFTIWSTTKDKKVIVRVSGGMVDRIEFWKKTCFGTWGKSQADRVRVG